MTVEIHAPHAIHVNEGGDDPLKLKIEPIHVKDASDNGNVTSRPGGSGGDGEDMIQNTRKRMRPEPVHADMRKIPVAFLEVVETEAVRRCRAIFKIEKDIAALKDYVKAAVPSQQGEGEGPGSEKVSATPAVDASLLPPLLSPSGKDSEDDGESQSQYANTELPVPSPDVVTDPGEEGEEGRGAESRSD